MTLARTAPGLVDIHPHVIASDRVRYPREPLDGHASPWSEERPVDAEGMLAAMDGAGIVQSVLVQASTCYGHDNRYVADSVAAHPTRFAGVFSVDATAPDARERMDAWAAQPGMAGLRLFIAGHSRPDRRERLDDPRAFPVWEAAARRKLPICVQMRTGSLAELRNLLERFPETRVVLDHLARPTLSDGPPYAAAAEVIALARYPQLFLKVSTHTVRESREGAATPETFFPRLVEAFGAHRLAWGSNFPASSGSLAAIADEARAAFACLASADREWILSRTARTLYPVLGEPAQA